MLTILRQPRGVDRECAAVSSQGFESAGFPKRSAILEQPLQKREQGHECRQHHRCKHHLNEGEAGLVFAKKPTCDNAANPQALKIRD